MKKSVKVGNNIIKIKFRMASRNIVSGFNFEGESMHNLREPEYDLS